MKVPISQTAATHKPTWGPLEGTGGSRSPVKFSRSFGSGKSLGRVLTFGPSPSEMRSFTLVYVFLNRESSTSYLRSKRRVRTRRGGGVPPELGLSEEAEKGFKVSSKRKT